MSKLAEYLLIKHAENKRTLQSVDNIVTNVLLRNENRAIEKFLRIEEGEEE